MPFGPNHAVFPFYTSYLLLGVDFRKPELQERSNNLCVGLSTKHNDYASSCQRSSVVHESQTKHFPVLVAVATTLYCVPLHPPLNRDLKPENILLVGPHNDVDVKITDFGLAKRANKEGLKTFCGTPQYFAPEVLKRRNTVLGVGRYGKEADMWSVGEGGRENAEGKLLFESELTEGVRVICPPPSKKKLPCCICFVWGTKYKIL